MKYKVKNFLIILLSVCYTFVFSQNAQMEETENELEINRKQPVTFTHQPFLLLKITPTSLFGLDNVFQFGGEIAPPIGMFSLNFDYGIGNAKWNVNKIIRNDFSDLKTKLWRAEIRTYFSDLYPFYSLDKKPFGRYYAIEYMNKDQTYSQPVAIAKGNTQMPNFVSFTKIPVVSKEQAIHLKFGKHFHINRYLFLDGYVGIGVGKFSLTKNETIESNVKIEDVLYSTQVFAKKNRKIDSKGLFFSKTAGIRICLVL